MRELEFPEIMLVAGGDGLDGPSADPTRRLTTVTVYGQSSSGQPIAGFQNPGLTPAQWTGGGESGGGWHDPSSVADLADTSQFEFIPDGSAADAAWDALAATQGISGDLLRTIHEGADATYREELERAAREANNQAAIDYLQAMENYREWCEAAKIGEELARQMDPTSLPFVFPGISGPMPSVNCD